MWITIKYGSRPGEKLIENGNFICPLCSRKRQYKRYKVVKEAFLGIISIPTKSIGEFIHCQGCLQVFPPNVLGSEFQLKVNIDDSDLPSVNIMDIWQDAYTSLNCEEFIAYKKGIVEVVNAYIFTMAKLMQDVGVKLRLQEYEEARKYLSAIINTGIEWQESNMKQNCQLQIQMPKLHDKIIAYIKSSHLILSHLS
jgi:hypothetical protein